MRQNRRVLLTLTMTGDGAVPASDLGYLLHKHPDRVQQFDVSTGTAHVFYPEATSSRCTAALLLEVDPVGLARRRGRGTPPGAGQYVGDRSYAASSLLAVALGHVFRTALRGRCDARPELAASPLDLQVAMPSLPCRGGPDLAARLFAPLGWSVDASPLPLDPNNPGQGASPYVQVSLTGSLRLADALNHLYVLLPVLDDAKHYWVTTDEVDKLVRAGTGWLAEHTERDLIVSRYLAHQRGLASDALERLADDTPVERLDDGSAPPRLAEREQLPLARQRVDTVVAVLRAAGAATVLDLGCGEGRLLAALLPDPAFTKVTGADVSTRNLERAARRLNLDRMGDRQRARLELLQAALTYRDSRLAGYDAAVLMEVIEHVDAERLPALARTVFGFASPGTVLVTTPNAEHNVRFADLPPGAFRHPDHRFEWPRTRFRDWAGEVASAYGYTVRFEPVGVDDAEVGPPTQLAVFTRSGADA